MKSTSKENAEGKINQVKGKIKESVGKARGDSDLEAVGIGENREGTAQEPIHEVKKIFGK